MEWAMYIECYCGLLMCNGHEVKTLSSSTFIMFVKCLVHRIAFLWVRVAQASKHKLFSEAIMILTDRQR